MKNTLTKIGLTGNGGMFPCSTSSNGKAVEAVGFLHVNAPYDSNGMVFVEEEDWWKRMPAKRAERQKKRVIRCYVCESPAVRLDHLWPYHTEMTACKDHLDWYSDWECQDIRSIGNLCRVVSGKLVVVKAVMA